LKNEKGQLVELSHSSFSAFLYRHRARCARTLSRRITRNTNRNKNSLAAALNASVQRDVYYARARNHKSAREVALFADRVPGEVYDELIETVHANLPAVHRYYELRRKKMKLRDIHQYERMCPSFQA